MYRKQSWIIGVTFLFIAGLILYGPVGQDAAYHAFADRRTLLGITNFFDTFSNIFFALLGGWGLVMLPRMSIEKELRFLYRIFFSALLLTAVASAYYHLQPGNVRLFWDRLALSILFGTFFSIVVGEFIAITWAKRIVWPMLLLALFSVLYWIITEQRGEGDLRLYIVVQFLALLLIVIIFILFRSRYSDVTLLYTFILCYSIAKIVESFDHQVFDLTGWISGHTLKHLLAALGLGVYIIYLLKRHRSES